jgi:hypothetical protein
MDRRAEPTQLLRAVAWSPIWDAAREGQGMEHLLLNARMADSVLLAFDETGSPYRLSYRLRWDDARRVRSARVHVVTETGESTLSLRSDGLGNWRDANRRELVELRGAIDLDIWPTPFTNSLPIWRLGDSMRKRQRIEVVYIAAPQLNVALMRQAYTRIGPGLYRFESIDSGFTADLPVDEDGVVLDYPGLFQRLG